MLWLYILLGIILLLVLVMLLPVKIYARYNDDFICTLFVGFVKIPIYPSKPKKEKKKPKNSDEKSKKEKKEPKKKKTNLIKEKGIAWLLELIKKVANLASSVLKDFFGHILIKKLLLSIEIAGSDAADTAVKYGQCCAVVYPAISAITRAVNCPKYGVDIMPDFDEKAKSKVEFELKARVFFFRLVLLVLKHGFRALKLFADLKN